MRVLLFILLAAVLTGTANAATVEAVNGNVVLGGKTITHGGHDLDPVLSPDGKRLVFLRRTAGRPLEDCAADATTSKPLELWSINADGSGAKKLLALKSDADVRKTVCAFDSMQFSSNGQLLYFSAPAWATSGAIHVYDFRSGREHFLLAGDGLKVLSDCKNPKYRDDLIVGQHRYFLFEGSYDWTFVFTPAGKEVGPLGDGDYTSALADACG
ncbi:MAG TPA: hypothetical protein VII56_23360 [Rhizomicrobium sp.]